MRKQRFVNAHSRSRLDKYLATGRLHIFIFPPDNAPEFAAYQARVTGPDAFVDLAVWRFDKAIRVDLSIRRQVTDKANIRTSRCFYRADASLTRAMYITDFKARSLSRDPPRATLPPSSL